MHHSGPMVVDASVAITILRGEAPARSVAQAIAAARRDGRRLLVPTFFWLEVLNTLARRYQYESHRLLEALAELDRTGLESVELDRPMLLLALDVIVWKGLTAYDAAYLALAESSDAELLTGDAELASAAGDRALLVGASEIREPRAAYAGHSSAEWPGAGAYLRELRAMVTAGSKAG